MRGRAAALVGVLLGAALGARPAAGQIAWDTPMLIGPGAPAGFGVFLMEPWPGNGIGVMGTYRTSPVPVGLGFRVGLGEGAGAADDDFAVFGGVDVSGFLTRTTGEVPLEVLWFTGGGLGIGGDLFLSFPLGLSVGANLQSEDVIFRPYAAPRVVLDAHLGDDGPGDNENLDLDLAVDLGLDLSFDPAWLIRFAATVGDDRDALLIGLAFPR